MIRLGDMLRRYRQHNDQLQTEITYVTNYNQPENQVVFAFSLMGGVINEISLS